MVGMSRHSFDQEEAYELFGEVPFVLVAEREEQRGGVGAVDDG